MMGAEVFLDGVSEAYSKTNTYKPLKESRPFQSGMYRFAAKPVFNNRNFTLYVSPAFVFTVHFASSSLHAADETKVLNCVSFLKSHTLATWLK